MRHVTVVTTQKKIAHADNRIIARELLELKKISVAIKVGKVFRGKSLRELL